MMNVKTITHLLLLSLTASTAFANEVSNQNQHGQLPNKTNPYWQAPNWGGFNQAPPQFNNNYRQNTNNRNQVPQANHQRQKPANSNYRPASRSPVPPRAGNRVQNYQGQTNRQQTNRQQPNQYRNQQPNNQRPAPYSNQVKPNNTSIPAFKPRANSNNTANPRPANNAQRNMNTNNAANHNNQRFAPPQYRNNSNNNRGNSGWNNQNRNGYNNNPRYNNARNNNRWNNGPFNNFNRNDFWGKSGPSRWMNPNKDNLEQGWDDMMNAPSRMGEMPGGWSAPEITVPNPVDMGDQIQENVQDLPEQIKNMDVGN